MFNFTLIYISAFERPAMQDVGAEPYLHQSININASDVGIYFRVPFSITLGYLSCFCILVITFLFIRKLT